MGISMDDRWGAGGVRYRPPHVNQRSGGLTGSPTCAFSYCRVSGWVDRQSDPEASSRRSIFTCSLALLLGTRYRGPIHLLKEA